MKKLWLIALAFGLLVPVYTSALTFVTPSGAVVDDQGHLLVPPPSLVATTTKKTITSSYESRIYAHTFYFYGF